MAIKITTNTTTSPTTTVFDRAPNTICSGFIDVHGTWNNGFACPIENLTQHFCCGTDTYRYCCSPDRYSFETRFYTDSNHVVDYPQVYNGILTDEITASLINNQRMINKQFQQFQKYFLPTFLLTTTILFLVGIALWFWLYKHKTYYSLTHDDFIQSRISHRIQTNSRPRLAENINLSVEQQHRSLSHSSTAV
ncbi:unnamed protein product [Rotaria sp. Silwood2]|nr:unnamed protein product [Rotaria sp. Silwood2]CAF2759059.1 unnamed protein product [Rotaria sp. Silwood2]CAF3875506.1 unnamed protein product [Rotaria sp. Silwood2]CAF4087978.1 unnamed protein product [Rotaria sp. Silwood2]